MNMTRYLTEEQLIERGLSALMKALGPIETRRFLNLPRSQRLESVQRHRQWQDTLNQEDFFDALFGPVPDSDFTKSGAQVLVMSSTTTKMT